MKRIDFFSLERPVQERFVDATRGQGIPTPLLMAELPLPYAAMRWGVLAAVLFAAWVWVTLLGYGSLDNGIALQPRWILGVHVALPLLAALAALRARSSLQERARLPFVQTAYLFPVGVIDARSGSFGVHAWDELVATKFAGGRARVQFAGGTFDFPLPKSEQPLDLERRLLEFKEQLGGGRLGEHDLVLLDPLRDNGFRNPFSPLESMRPPKPRELPWLALASVLVAVAAGYGVWQARNVLGERALYARAARENTVSAYRAYIARGGTRREVTDLLLPRAELRVAVAEGGVEPLERYMASHRGSKIGGEVQNALRAALLHALEEAKTKNTITAFREFERRYAQHLALVPELPHARFAYLSGVLEHFQRTAKPSRELWQLARRLIVYADKHPPPIELRFAQRESRSLEKNEHQLMASAYYGGEKTLPSHYLVGPPVRSAEARAGAELAKALAQVFPTDLLHFELGVPLPANAPDSPTFDKPTLLVSYRLEISGAFVSKKPRAVFTGVGLIADATLSIPDKEPSDTYKHSAWHAPDQRRIEAGELPTEQVYGEILNKAFGRFAARYSAPWLGKEQ